MTRRVEYKQDVDARVVASHVLQVVFLGDDVVRTIYVSRRGLCLGGSFLQDCCAARVMQRN